MCLCLCLKLPYTLMITSPECTLHTAINHKITILEWQTLTCYMLEEIMSAFQKQKSHELKIAMCNSMGLENNKLPAELISEE